MYEVLNDYKKFEEVSQELINKYTNVLPEDVLEIWKNLGFGSFMNGYFRVINPDDYRKIIDETYFNAKNTIPFMVTAFGDILTWEKNQFVGILMYRKQEWDLIRMYTNKFFKDLSNPAYIKESIQNEKYDEAYEKLGDLQMDECYGYVPLLGIGGAEKVENLQIVKTKEHIELITQLVGVFD